MERTGEIICFVCDNTFPLDQLQNHVNKCKVVYEHNNNCHLIMPEEYKIILDAYKSGVYPDGDELENFNRMIEEKSIKYGQSFATKQQFKEMNAKFTETIKKSKEPIKEKRAPGQRPRMLICPLCGREFGSMSLNIHLKTCKEKFNRQQQDLPPNMRRNADKIIQNYEKSSAKLGGSGNYNIDAMNQDAFDNYNNNALVKCENCGRTFLPDRLVVHQRSCNKHPDMFKKKK
jgi:hypothetical protein